MLTGDYVCGSLSQLVLNNKPASVALVASARGCTGHSFVSTLSYKFCCVGSAFSFKSESCAKAPESLAYPPTTTPYIPTTTLATTRYQPTTKAVGESKSRRWIIDKWLRIMNKMWIQVVISWDNGTRFQTAKKNLLAFVWCYVYGVFGLF